MDEQEVTTEETTTGETAPREATTWAKPVGKLAVPEAPAGTKNINVDGRQLSGPLQGFGQMWQKSFKIRLEGVDSTPEQVMEAWKARFPEFQPPENRFYPTMSEITPGEVLLIEAKVPPFPGMPSMLPVATGVMVLYADEESFTVMCPEGHPLSGWNTFSVYDDDGTLVAMVQEQSRASDPFYEFFFRVLGSSNQQDKIWEHVLTSLAADYGVSSEVTLEKTLLDPSVRWSGAKNIWNNAGIRTIVYVLAAPIRWIRR
ncbi:MAG: hypothetical protein R3335_12720 [Anaerolineales bacterium]|nr:hypothetical protein [Anaerolineales bacterium]